jgi:hypothetical protein
MLEEVFVETSGCVPDQSDAAISLLSSSGRVHECCHTRLWYYYCWRAVWGLVVMSCLRLSRAAFRLARAMKEERLLGIAYET